MKKTIRSREFRRFTESNTFRYGVLSADRKRLSVTERNFQCGIIFAGNAAIILSQSKEITVFSVFHVVVTTPLRDLREVLM